jgi:photosystem II stability/assembly factor-like uncharacterized protein
MRRVTMALIRYIVVCIIFTCNAGIIIPQWIQTSGPGGGNVTCVVSNGDNIFAGTYEGGPYLSTNNGLNWTQVNNGLPSISYGISTLMIKGDTIFAGIIDGSSSSGLGIYSSSDNGISWKKSSNGLDGKWVLSIVSMGNNIFAGTKSGIYISTDNGSTWTQTNNGLPINVYVYAFTVMGNKIFAGTNGGGPNGPGGIYVSTDNGTTWLLTNNGLQYRPDIAFSINKKYELAQANKPITRNAARNAKYISPLLPLRPTVYALTVSNSNILAGTTEGTYISADTGTTWQLITDGLIYGEYVYSIAVSGEIIFAATSGGIYISTNNGTLWTEIIDGLPINSCVNSLFIKDNLVVAGTGGGIYYSTNSGNSWTEGNYGLTSVPVTALAVKGNYIFAGTFNNSGSEGIYRSSDYGDTWTYSNNGIPAGTWINTIAINGNNIFAGTSSYNGTSGIFLSTDDGLSWIQSGLPNQSVRSFVFSNSNVFAGTDAGVYLSTDNGNSWVARNNGIPSGVYIDAITIKGDKIFAGGMDAYLQPPTEMYLSTDDGLNWKVINKGLPDDALITTLSCNGDNIFAGTGYDEGSLYLSTNDGSSWTIVNNGITGYFTRSVIFKGDTIFASTSPGGVFISTNNGTNWNSLNDGLSNTNVEALALTGNYLLAGEEGVWRRHLSPQTLPVELKSFTTTVKQNKIELKWNTAIEVNNYGFEIQRARQSNSLVPDKWETLGFIQGSGNSNSSHEYSFTDKTINGNGKYNYRLKQIDNDGRYVYSNTNEVNVKFVKLNYALENNYPNPYNPTTIIRYSLPYESDVKLIVYNSLGQAVKVLVSEVQQNGIHEANFDGSNLSSGVYFYKMNSVSVDGSQNFTASKKMILLK